MEALGWIQHGPHFIHAARRHWPDASHRGIKSLGDENLEHALLRPEALGRAALSEALTERRARDAWRGVHRDTRATPRVQALVDLLAREIPRLAPALDP